LVLQVLIVNSLYALQIAKDTLEAETPAEKAGVVGQQPQYYLRNIIHWLENREWCKGRGKPALQRIPWFVRSARSLRSGQPSFIGFDGVAGGSGEVRREAIEREPADFFRFGGLAVEWAHIEDTRKERGRNPVLTLAGEAMLRDRKQGLDGNVDADFFASFANRALLERLEIVQLSADDAPAAGLGRENAEGEQDALAVVHQKHTHADARSRSGMRGGA
jgi:hypothetical protein